VGQKSSLVIKLTKQIAISGMAMGNSSILISSAKSFGHAVVASLALVWSVIKKLADPSTGITFDSF
jgi:hypothetical protein